MNTGFTQLDAEAAFARERRRQSLAKLSSRLGIKRRDALAILPFEDVVEALGLVAERDVGLRSIALESIVGTAGRRRADFDRRFRPGSNRLRGRWQSIAAARMRGESMEPIDVYRIGRLHFVRDGHHRVSVARANGDPSIEAYVREVQTKVAPTEELSVRDLRPTEPERELRDRLPVPSGTPAPSGACAASSCATVVG
jgi:hypothetical protein